MKFSLTLVTTVLISYHLYAHDLLPLSLSLILFFRYVSSDAVADRVLSKAFFFVLIIIFLPQLPRYLINVSAFGWTALPILFFYAALTLEIFRRTRVGR